MQKGNSKNGVFYAVGAYCFWGVLPIYWKMLKSIPAGDILAHRIFWSFIFLAIIITLTKRWQEFKQAFKSLRTVLAIAAASILISLNWLIYIWAVNNNHIIEASLGYYINPLFTIMLGGLVLGEKLDKWQVVALTFALVGVGVITIEYGSIPWVALTLAISFALYGLAKKMSSLSSLNGLTAETMMVAPLAMSFLFFQVAGSSETYAHLTFTLSILIPLTGVVTSVPLLLFAQGAKRISLTTLGFVQYLSPSISLLIGIFIYKEPFTIAHQICFGLIWTAIGIYSFTREEILERIGFFWTTKRSKKLPL